MVAGSWLHAGPQADKLQIGDRSDSTPISWPDLRLSLCVEELHHASDYTPYEGLDVSGQTRSVFIRGSVVIRDGAFVGQRGFGRFVDRGTTGA